MKILVIGSGGREHAIVRKLKESPQVDALYCAPGNGGISRDAECSPVNVMDKEGMLALAREKQVDLVFVAPDGFPGSCRIPLFWSQRESGGDRKQQGVFQKLDEKVWDSHGGV